MRIAQAETLYAAAEDGKSGQALTVLREIRALLELLSKATGDLS